jgi:hypothetical protein
MNSKRISLVLSAVMLLAAAAASAGRVPAQKVETVNGVRVVHNAGRGVWGRKPAVKLEPVRKIGDVDAADEKTAFYLPATVALDGAGNIYVLDSGNNRIQKFTPDAKYLATFGRQGQGPGEFSYPTWLDIDSAGNLYVSDPMNERVQVLGPDGREIRTIKSTGTGIGNAFVTSNGNLVMGEPRLRFGAFMEEGKPAALPKLVKVTDPAGKLLREFGEQVDMKDELLTKTVNEAVMTVDLEDNIYLAFPYQNRFEKYSPDGRLLWRADRELPYSLEVQEKGRIERQGGGVSISAPKINRSSEAVAVDGRGRVWVVTLARQLKKEEQAGIGVGMSMSVGGGRTVQYKVYGDTDLRATDAYKLEVFDPEGTLLGAIPLDFFADGIRIFGDRLFLIDRLRGASVHEFRIRE